MAAAAARVSEWLSSRQVDELSSSLHDSPEMARLRAAAYQAFTEQPLEPDPLYRKYGYFGGVDLTGLNALTSGAAVPDPPTQSSTIEIVHDASGTRIRIPTELRDAGIQVHSYEEIVERGGEPAAHLLGGGEPVPDKLTALGLALINRAVSVDLPNDLKVPVRLKDVTVLSQPHEALSVHRTIRAGRAVRLLASEEVFSTRSATPHQRLYASSTDITVGDDAHVSYVTLHSPDADAISLYSRHATVAAHAHLGWVWSGFNGFRTKLRNRSQLFGQGASLEDLQAFYGAGHQAYDSGVRVEHIGTDTHGQSVTRGVFRDEARGMSRGLVRIEKDARRTLSYLSEHAMLLSKGARSDTIPILEILCRDVKATHSSSVAPVDPEKVFYLETRGIPADSAIRMIGEGFLSHVFERAPILQLRDVLYPYLAARWDGREVPWDDGSMASMPPLEVSGPGADTEWRFDSKLR
jgi:Fe-S cluster assembly scaffold protein SufB